jgi:hypothetical protein
MLVKAKCVAQAFDNQGKHLYYPGDVVEMNSESSLAQLLTPAGKWVFTWDGRQPPDPKLVAAMLHAPIPEPVPVENPKPQKAAGSRVS